jgi:hypothetical protein
MAFLPKCPLTIENLLNVSPPPKKSPKKSQKKCKKKIDTRTDVFYILQNVKYILELK